MGLPSGNHRHGVNEANGVRGQNPLTSSTHYSSSRGEFKYHHPAGVVNMSDVVKKETFSVKISRDGDIPRNEARFFGQAGCVE